MTALSASAGTRLQNALDSWTQDSSSFTYHLSLQPEIQHDNNYNIGSFRGFLEAIQD